MAEIKIGKYTVFIDETDWENLKHFKWHMGNHGYAQRSAYKNGKTVKVLMHREIMQTPKGFHTDHINGNKCDNRRCNLRVATASQNIANAKLSKNNTSGCKGVRQIHNGRWKARLTFMRNEIHLGYYATYEDATIAREQAVKKYFGDFGKSK